MIGLFEKSLDIKKPALSWCLFWNWCPDAESKMWVEFLWLLDLKNLDEKCTRICIPKFSCFKNVQLSSILLP